MKKKTKTKTTAFKFDKTAIKVETTIGGLKKIQKALKNNLKEPLKLMKLVDTKLLKMQNKKTKKATQTDSPLA